MWTNAPPNKQKEVVCALSVLLEPIVRIVGNHPSRAHHHSRVSPVPPHAPLSMGCPWQGVATLCGSRHFLVLGVNNVQFYIFIS